MVKERFGFADLMDVARFGAAVAMARGLSASGRPPGAAVNTWNLGSVDRDGELRALVGALYPDIDDDPGVVLETLMNRGLELLGDLLDADDEPTLISLVQTSRRPLPDD
jgi:hypothetical protein